MNILLFGKDGQLGLAFQSALQRMAGAGVLITSCGRSECDLASAESLEILLHTVKPHLIINASAYTAVDKAEQEPELAESINARAPAIMASYAAQHGVTLLHYSTDYVFDGGKQGRYEENDLRNPLSVYGKSKAAGELAIINAFDQTNASGRYAIFRTSWVYGLGANFIRTILRLAKERNQLKVIDDQYGVPTSAQWLATLSSFFLLDLSRSGDVSLRDFQSGIYHVVPSGETSWHGLACEVVRVASEAGAPLTLAIEGIEPIPAVEYPLPAPRPMNSRLSTVKLAAELQRLGLMSKLADSNNALSQPWSESVCAYVKKIVTQGDI